VFGVLPARFQSTLAPVAFVVAAALLGVILWPQLPSEMAIHFDASSTPDNYVSKPVGVFLTPAIGLGAILFVRAKMAVDNVQANPVSTRFSMLFTGIVIAYVQVLVLVWNLGYTFDMTTAVVPVLLGAGAFVWYQYRITE
jgi:uncharacterized membrane protein